jgi:hypothetical protein
MLLPYDRSQMKPDSILSTTLPSSELPGLPVGVEPFDPQRHEIGQKALGVILKQPLHTAGLGVGNTSLQQFDK